MRAAQSRRVCVCLRVFGRLVWQFANCVSKTAASTMRGDSWHRGCPLTSIFRQGVFRRRVGHVRNECAANSNCTTRCIAAVRSAPLPHIAECIFTGLEKAQSMHTHTQASTLANPTCLTGMDTCVAHVVCVP